ncbi:MAG: hypothetical protein IID08_05810 [Candidatus Hydrogenedentes bacterium]|nr:hypothetical protein [Candidatus Hydrogenedentota bacterium]
MKRICAIALGCLVLLPLAVWTGDVPCLDCGPGRVELAQMVVDPYTLFPGGPVAGDAATNFDASDDYFSATSWYPADSDKGIMSFWVRRDTTGVAHMVHAGSNNRYRIIIGSDDKIVFWLRNTSGGTILDIDSGSTTIADTNWHHVLFSWELDASPRSWMYIDDIDVKNVTTEALGIADWTRVINRTGASGAGTAGTFLDGCLSEFYVQIGEFLDFSVTANRRLFIDASSKPVDLGSDGSTPTELQPEVYIPGDDFTDNKGTNANLTAAGSPVACSNNPG